MKRAGRFAPGVEVALMLGLGFAAIYAGLAPYSLVAERPPAPDLVYCLVAGWVVRRPAAAPLWAILVLGLAGDLLLSRPLGLGALGLMLGAEALRANAAALRGRPFLLEWVAVAAVCAASLAGVHLALEMTFLQGPGFGALARQAGTTALAYPLVAAVLFYGLGMRAPRRVPGFRPAGADRMREGTPAAPRITRRGLMLLGLQFGVIGALGWRMRDLQIEQNARYALLAEENRINIRLIPPARGLIFDREGRALALNRQNYRIVMVREQSGDAAVVLARLGTIIDLPPDRQERALREMTARSAFVPVVVAEHLTWDDVARVSANAPVLPGVIAEVGLSRFYPDAYATSHVVGYVGPVSENDLAKLEDPDPVLQIPRFQIGKTGIEQRLESRLRGTAGNMRIEVSAAGRVMRELGRVEGVAGADIQLTVDKGVQNFAMQRMAGESAATVVIEVATGDVVALASSPGFDPNAFVFGVTTAAWRGLMDDEYRPLSNKTVAGAYPPGSTFKMVVALAALEAGVVRPGDTVNCGGFTRLGNRRFHCWKAGGHGRVDLKRSLAQSCDVYYYEMARRVGADAISAMAKKLGLGVRHDLPMPAVTEGLMPDRAWKAANRDEAWGAGDSFNYGIGQGFTLASPLQLAVMTARIASGAAVAPRLVRAVGGVPEPLAPAAALEIDPRHLRLVREGMYAVSNEGGTAARSRIADPAMLMAGKTGTSQVRIISAAERAAGVTRNDQLPWNRRDHALFVAFAPYDAPRYAIAQVVEHGGGGSAVAAPVARDILMRALYGDLPPLSAYPPDQRSAAEAMLQGLQPLPETEPAAPRQDRA